MTGGSIRRIAPQGYTGEDRQAGHQHRGHRAQGLPEVSEHVPLSPGRWQPWLCHPQETGPPSSSRAPGLLFLGLSLHVFWATAIRGHLAKGSDSLKTTCQLQQQRNDLE